MLLLITVMGLCYFFNNDISYICLKISKDMTQYTVKLLYN